jgi:hypothetical protein
MDIKHRDCTVGSIKLPFDAALTAQREFDNITFGIQLQLSLRGKPLDRRWILFDFTADLRAQGTSSCLLGSGGMAGALTPAIDPIEFPGHLSIRCSPRALASYEAFRNGGPVRLRCEVRYKIHSLVAVEGGHCLSEPESQYDGINIEFPKETWNKALRSCGMSASVLVELPLPLSDADHLDEGSRAVLDALEAFEHGGTTGWKDTVGHIRPYLEAWKNREPLPPYEPKDGSATDRAYKLLSLRDALYKCCHFWVHESKASCTRPDAVLALATFASLLNAR